MLVIYTDLVAEMTTNGEPDALRCALAGITYARWIGSEECEARLLGSLSILYRARKDLHRAGSCLDRALALGTPKQRSYLLRRLAFLRYECGDEEQAVSVAARAVACATSDHDRAKSLDVLAVKLAQVGQMETAISLFEKALRLVDENAAARDLLTIVQNYATALASSRRPQVEAALALLFHLLGNLGEKKFMQRAKLNWVIGWCFYRLGRRTKAMRYLKVAQRCFIGIARRSGEPGHPVALPEIAAVTADLAEITPLGVRGILKVIQESRIFPKTHPLAEHLTQLAQVPMRRSRRSSEDAVRSLARKLRAAAQAMVICPPALDDAPLALAAR